MEELQNLLDSTVLSEKDGKRNDASILRMSSSVKRISKFLEPALSFLNCHFTNYFVRSYWESFVPDKLRLDLESKTVDNVKKCVVDLSSGRWKDYPEAREEVYNPDWNFHNVASLEELIVAVGKLKLSELHVCTSFSQLEQNRSSLKRQFPELFVDLKFDTFMSSKKMHEVLKFSEFIACACNGIDLTGKYQDTDASFDEIHLKSQIPSVVDVGSGKGYLSSFLALYYDFKVLAIDASASNTEGCDKRSAKLDKTWPQLVRRAKERQQHGTCTSLGRHWKKSLDKKGITVEEYRNSLKSQIRSSEQNLKSITEMITTKTDLQNLVAENLIPSDDGNETERNCRSEKYGVVGLHTCGNLGANILKLFINNENAHFICVVPCCYNLVKEDETLYPERAYYGSKFGNETASSGKSAPWPDGSIGFPLSKPLQNHDGNGKPFVIGRNARMLSAYSLPRMIDSETGLEMPPVLYYRAMLQVVLKRLGMITDVDTNDDGDFRVGRMIKKCTSFKEYVSFALTKFQVDISEIMTGGIIKDVESSFASTEILAKFHKYYLLRAIFASVIEDLILLDRMVYLLEQDSIAAANVVQLFDPALSPRSHAIVAVKK